MWENIGYVIAGLVLLILGGDWLLKSSVGLSLRLRISRVVIGLTVVSFATSAPELIVSVNAALSGVSDIALGNVVGSNIANVTLVLGLTLLFGSMSISKGFYRSDWPIMMLVSLLLFLLMYFDGDISRSDGLILVLCLCIFVWYLFKFQKDSIDMEEVSGQESLIPMAKIILFLILGGGALWLGSESLIKGSVGLARSFGISDRVISITIVSVGTSIPELAASIIAMIKKEKAISLGNLIGSNIFNILAVLGITSLIAPIEKIDEKFLSGDLFWMLGAALLLLFLSFFKGRMFTWVQGVIMLIFYMIFVYFAVI